MAEMNLLSATAASNNAAVPDGAPEGWTGANVNDVVRELMAKLARWYADPAFVEPTFQLATVGAKSLTRVSATRIDILACDASAIFTAPRRIRIVGATTDYGHVVSSTFNTPNTEVTVEMDSGDIPTSPTEIKVQGDPLLGRAAYYDIGNGSGLDADTLDGLDSAAIMGLGYRNLLINGGLEIWQRYTGSAISCPAATRTFAADRWWTNPAGAAVTADRTTSTPTGARSKFALLVTGATSVTAVTLAGQRIESRYSPAYKRIVTVSALVKNTTSGDLTVSILIGTPGAADDFTTVTNRFTTATTLIASGASARISAAFNLLSLVNGDNGMQVEFQVPSGALDAASKSITISEMQLELGGVFTQFGLEKISDVEIDCARYYWLTGAKAETSTTGLHCVFSVRNIAGTRFGFGSHPWPVQMRATPTVTVWASGVSGQVYNADSEALQTGFTATRITDKGCRAITTAASPGTDEMLVCNLEASAEL